ncbi:MAG: hypothetical protein EXR69_11850 [Myxococcales bacterium]|nr:hypothetical protein [Myxococcales bacterium]
MSLKPLLLVFAVLAGCTEPPVLDLVTERLAEQVLEVAEPQMRLLIGVSAVVAEACTVESLNGYRFVGEAALALGVTEAGVTTTASGGHTWTFEHVGLDGTDGMLILSTDSERTTVNLSYIAANNTLVNGVYHVLSCDAPAPAPDTGADTASDTGDTGTAAPEGYTVNVSGNLEFETVDGTNYMAIEGDKPYSALTWLPPTAFAPRSGWVHWSDQEANPSEEITLEGATNIDYTARTWPGKATGNRWVRSITIGLP